MACWITQNLNQRRQSSVARTHQAVNNDMSLPATFKMIELVIDAPMYRTIASEVNERHRE